MRILLILISLHVALVADIVSDSETGLMWQDDTLQYKNWKDAISYCDALTLADFDNWYLPNINELFSIVDLTRVNLAISDSFTGKVESSNSINNERFWSSTNIYNEIKVERAYYVNFALGTIESNMEIKSESLTRCVRRIY